MFKKKILYNFKVNILYTQLNIEEKNCSFNLN